MASDKFFLGRSVLIEQNAKIMSPGAISVSELADERRKYTLSRFIVVVSWDDRREADLRCDLPLQFVDPPSLAADNRYYRHSPKRLRQFLAVDMDSLALSQVDHIQGDYHRHPDLEDLEKEIQAALKIGCVDYGDDSVRPCLGIDIAEQGGSGDVFVGSEGRE